MEKTLQSVFQLGFDDYLKTHEIPFYYHQAARLIMTCRTAVLGGHSQYCENNVSLREHRGITCVIYVASPYYRISVLAWRVRLRPHLKADEYHQHSERDGNQSPLLIEQPVHPARHCLNQ